MQAYHRERAKWINNNHLVTTATNGTFRIDSVDTDSPNGKKLALRYYLSTPFIIEKVPLRYYYFEHHVCRFVDPYWGNSCGKNYLKPAIYIRLNSNTDQLTFIIKTTLRSVNDTYVDPVHKLTFTLKDITPSSAVININKKI